MTRACGHRMTTSGRPSPEGAAARRHGGLTAGIACPSRRGRRPRRTRPQIADASDLDPIPWNFGNAHHVVVAGHSDESAGARHRIRFLHLSAFPRGLFLDRNLRNRPGRHRRRSGDADDDHALLRRRTEMVRSLFSIRLVHTIIMDGNASLNDCLWESGAERQ